MLVIIEKKMVDFKQLQKKNIQLKKIKHLMQIKKTLLLNEN